MLRVVCCILFFCVAVDVSSQRLATVCGDYRYSDRLANYVMSVTLDAELKTVTGTQTITWTNSSPDPVSHVMMYMYINAFKSPKSSYLSDSRRWNSEQLKKKEIDWGAIDLISISDTRDDRALRQEYVANIDNNPHDETALKVELNKPVQPGETLTIKTIFRSKLPRLMVRTGFAEDDFFHFVHWYPKLGVFEQSQEGRWSWNCHQFLPGMEFYGDFGVYDVTISAPAHLTIGASGCRLAMKAESDDMIKHHFVARDVIDFGWVAYRDFDVYYDQWKHVEIELLSPSSHHRLVERLIGAVRNSLEYMERHVGPYPYDKITVMDPPVHGMRSGFMEYPMYITGGSFFLFPPQVKSMESLVVHEFCHQYFMAIVANNEKEAPWLDEGFVTFFEDQIMEHYYGGSESSLVDAFGFTMGNAALTRSEYVGMEDPTIDAIATPGWEIKGPYKGTIYSKTATVLRTMLNWLGEETFYEMIRCYYETYAFDQPRADDFFEILYQYAGNHLDEQEMLQFRLFIKQAIYERKVCDFNVKSLSSTFDESSRLYSSTIVVEQLGEMIIPVDVQLTFADGSSVVKSWDGDNGKQHWEVNDKSPVVRVIIDPAGMIPLDLNTINNSLAIKSQSGAASKYASRTMYWLQNLFNVASFIL